MTPVGGSRTIKAVRLYKCGRRSHSDRAVAGTQQRKNKLYPEVPAAAAGARWQQFWSLILISVLRKRLTELLIAGGYDVRAVADRVDVIEGFGLSTCLVLFC